MKIVAKATVCVVLACSLTAYGQTTDPVDKNKPGATLGGGLQFGQANKTGGSNPGLFWNLSGELGYVIKRDTWNRIEFGAELGTGRLMFETDDTPNADVSVDLNGFALFKAGYGYSLGGHAFGIWRIGAGLTAADLDIDVGGASVTDSGQGLIGMIGWDAVFPASDSLDFVAGLNLRHYNFSWDDADSFQVNAPAMYVMARARL
jgi:hypothetical protein